MAGLLIIAHAPLAGAFGELARHAYADVGEALQTVDIPAGDEVDVYLARATAALDRLPDGEALILTDVFGATPCNVARRLAESRGLRVLIGLNVPMLWRALNYRHKPLEDLATLAMAGANQGVMQLAATRPQNQARQPARHDPNDGQDQQ